MAKPIDINAGFGEKTASPGAVLRDDLDGIFERAGLRAQKWTEVNKRTGPCDKRRVEELLNKRAEYLGIKPRKIVWCSSVEALKENFKGQSVSDLLYDRDHYWIQFIQHLENQIRSQLREPAGIQYPGKPFSYTLDTLRFNVEESLSWAWTSHYYVPQELFLDFLWDSFLNERKGIWHYREILEFWKETINIVRGAFYDCLWYCLPDRTRIKNYYAYLGEAHGEGLAFWLPTKTAEFLLPLPYRPLTEIVPEVEELPDLLDLAAFEERLSDYRLPEEILERTKNIIGIIKQILLILKKNYPKSSLVSEVERIAKNYLSQLLKSYAGLSAKSRSEKSAAMLSILGILEEELQKISELIESRKVQDFEVVAEFLKERFRPGSFEA